MKNILIHAKEHSIIHDYSWVLKKGDDAFYTDSEELYGKYIENGYKCTAEFYKGEMIK